MEPDMTFPRRYLLGALVILAAVVAPGAAGASVAPGQLQPGFVPLAQRFGDPTGNESATSVAVRDDGRLVVAAFNDVDLDRMIVGLRADGQLDTSFSGDGVWRMPSGDDTIIRAVTTQADGKVVFAGDDATTNTMVIGRLMKDGELDPTFGNGDGLHVVTTTVGAAPRIERVFVEPDGKVTFAGTTYVIGKARERVSGKLTATGLDDPAFVGTPYLTVGGGGSGDNDRLGGIVRMNDGSYVMGDAHGTGMTGIWKIGPNGNWSMLKDINLVNTVDEPVDVVAVDASHVAVLVTGTPWNTALTMVNTEATPALDTSFGTNGIATPFASSMRGEQILRQGDGRLLVAGFDGTHRTIERLDATGTPDATFGVAGVVSLGGSSQRSSSIKLHHVAIETDGSIVSASHVGAPDTRVVAVDRVLGRVSRVRAAVLTSVAAPYTNTATAITLRTINDGPDMTGPATAAFAVASELRIDAVTGGTCTLATPTSGSCLLAPIAAGASRDVTLTVRSATIGTRAISLRVSGSFYDDVTSDDESNLALAFAAPPLKVTPNAVSIKGSAGGGPTPAGASGTPQHPVLPKMALRRIARLHGRVMGCGRTVRGACRIARIRRGHRTAALFLRASAYPLPGTDKRNVRVTVQRKEHGRFITRGGGTLGLSIRGIIEFPLPKEMRGAADTWRMRIFVARTSTSKAARSAWFYVRVA
jgi:uncharacterized delta-60 repeat protein